MKRLPAGSATRVVERVRRPDQLEKVEAAQRLLKAVALAPLAIGTAIAKLQLRVMTAPRVKRPLPGGSR